MLLARQTLQLNQTFTSFSKQLVPAPAMGLPICLKSCFAKSCFAKSLSESL